jgi:hypothetical protein
MTRGGTRKGAGRPTIEDPLKNNLTVRFTDKGFFEVVHCATLTGEKIGEFCRKAVEERCKKTKEEL